MAAATKKTTDPLMLLHEACTATEARGNQVILDASGLLQACTAATVQIRALGEQFAATSGNTELQALFTEELTACVRLAATLPREITDCQADLAELDPMLEEATTRCQMAKDSRAPDLTNLASFARFTGKAPPFTCHTSLKTYCRTHELALQKLQVQRMSFGERLRVVLGANGETIKSFATSTELLRSAAQSSPAWKAAEETANAAASEAASQRAAARTARLETQRATQPVERISFLTRIMSCLMLWKSVDSSTAAARKRVDESDESDGWESDFGMDFQEEDLTTLDSQPGTPTEGAADEPPFEEKHSTALATQPDTPTEGAVGAAPSDFKEEHQTAIGSQPDPAETQRSTQPKRKQDSSGASLAIPSGRALTTATLELTNLQSFAAEIAHELANIRTAALQFNSKFISRGMSALSWLLPKGMTLYQGNRKCFNAILDVIQSGVLEKQMSIKDINVHLKAVLLGICHELVRGIEGNTSNGEKTCGWVYTQVTDDELCEAFKEIVRTFCESATERTRVKAVVQPFKKPASKPSNQALILRVEFLGVIEKATHAALVNQTKDEAGST